MTADQTTVNHSMLPSNWVVSAAAAAARLVIRAGWPCRAAPVVAASAWHDICPMTTVAEAERP